MSTRGMPVLRVRIIGPGRVGQALEAALAHVGHEVVGLLGRGADVSAAAEGVDLLVITTPDDSIAAVAAAVRPVATTVVAHCSGTSTLDVLAPHPRVGSFHPLAAIPDAATGFIRLTSGANFAVDGDPLVEAVVADLGGRSFHVDPADRVRYHAAAVIASNHLVALFGQVERIANEIGLPVDAYLDLAQQTLDNLRRLGPSGALTGPVARGDWATVHRHLLAVGPAERSAYQAMAEQASRLTGRSAPTIGAERRGDRASTSEPGTDGVLGRQPQATSTGAERQPPAVELTADHGAAERSTPAERPAGIEAA